MYEKSASRHPSTIVPADFTLRYEQINENLTPIWHINPSVPYS